MAWEDEGVRGRVRAADGAVARVGERGADDPHAAHITEALIAITSPNGGLGRMIISSILQH